MQPVITRKSAVADGAMLRVTGHFTKSLKVIGNGTNQKLGYGFLFTFCNNCGCICSRLWDILRQATVCLCNNSLSQILCVLQPVSLYCRENINFFSSVALILYSTLYTSK